MAIKNRYKVLIFKENSFWIFEGEKPIKVEKSLEETCIVVLPRNKFYIDKIQLPSMALENGQEVAYYQAEKIFDREDLEATLLPLNEQEERTECLLIALETSVLKEIEARANELRLNIKGISAASFVAQSTLNLDFGAIEIKWDNFLEVALIEKRKVVNIYLLEPENPLLVVIKNKYKKIEEVSLSKLTFAKTNTPVLFSVNINDFKKDHIKYAAKLAIFGSLLLPLIWAGVNLKRTNQEIKNLQIKKDKLKKEVSFLLKTKDENEKLKQKIESIEKVLNGLKPIKVLSLLSRIFPEGTVITTFSLEGDKVNIFGYTNSTSELIEKLGKSRKIADIKIRSSGNKVRRGEFKDKESFSISFRIKMEAGKL